MLRRPAGGAGRRKFGLLERSDEEEDGVLVEASDGIVSKIDRDEFTLVERDVVDGDDKDRERRRRRRRPLRSPRDVVSALLTWIAAPLRRCRCRCRCRCPCLCSTCPCPSQQSALRLSGEAVALPPRSKFALLLAAIASFHLLRVSVVRPASRLLFGPFGSTQGGLLGIFVDYQLRLHLVRRTMREREEGLRLLGVTDLPDPPPVFGGRRTFPVLPNVVLGEMLRREIDAMRTKAELEGRANEFEEACRRGAATSSMTGRDIHHGSSAARGDTGNVPRAILRPILGPWIRPYRGELSDVSVLTFDENEMRAFVRDGCPVVWDVYSSLLGSTGTDAEARVEMWALCAVWRYGGLYLGAGAVDLEGGWTHAAAAVGLVRRNDDSGLTPEQKGPGPVRDSCPESKGLAVLGGGSSSSDSASASASASARVKLLSATPRHPSLLCAMRSIAAEYSAEGRRSGTYPRGAVATALGASVRRRRTEEPSWTLAQTDCAPGDGEHGCCDRAHRKEVSAGDIPYLARSDGDSTFYVRAEDRPGGPRGESSSSPPAVAVTVTIREREGTPQPMRMPKSSLLSQMQKGRGGGSSGGGPSWLCDRCLRSPLWGTFERCGGVCGSDYFEAVCPSTAPEEKAVVVDVLIKSEQADGNVFRRSAAGNERRRIPRIIHQTYSERITVARHPHLKRLQNSWRSSGWEYRFYTDEEARAYVAEHYPRRFVDAFDALLPGAYKADFFRYLVLLRDGGIYADVDVLLTVNLDEAVSPTTSFLVPRDRVAEYAPNGTYCLWNGFMGSEPGHPFLVRAVERTVNLVSGRADMFDMEREACQSSASSAQGMGSGEGGRATMEDWKVRAEPGLLLSGPCALGVAVNEAMGNDPLAAFDVGWLDAARFPRTALPSARADGSGADRSDADVGDALILVADKRDLGSQRFSDPERNTIIASTDMAGLIKSPLELSLPPPPATQVPGKYYGTRGNLRPEEGEKPHYSAAAKGQWLWGSVGVYADLMVTNERIKLQVSAV